MRRLLCCAPDAVIETGDAVLRGTLRLISDLTLTRVSRKSALGRYERAGYDVAEVADIRGFDVAVPDKIVGRACRVWTTVAGAAGVATSVTGPIGFATDIPTLLANNLMAVGEVATIYGFDVAYEDEHAYATALLFLQGEEDDPAAACDPGTHLAEIARHIRDGARWEDIRDQRAGRWLRTAATELAWYLIKRKVAGIVPGVGPLVAGSVNARFTSRTCATARRIYRERFMSEICA